MQRLWGTDGEVKIVLDVVSWPLTDMYIVHSLPLMYNSSFRDDFNYFSGSSFLQLLICTPIYELNSF